MDTAPLILFAQKVSDSNRLLFADLRRLQRDILPEGITTRAEAEVLLSLDHIPRLDGAWGPYLAEAVARFALSGSEPPGLDPEIETWLTRILQATQPGTAASIVRAIGREGREMDERLTALVRRPARRAENTGQAASEMR